MRRAIIGGALLFGPGVGAACLDATTGDADDTAVATADAVDAVNDAPQTSDGTTVPPDTTIPVTDTSLPSDPEDTATTAPPDPCAKIAGPAVDLLGSPCTDPGAALCTADGYGVEAWCDTASNMWVTPPVDPVCGDSCACVVTECGHDGMECYPCAIGFIGVDRARA